MFTVDSMEIFLTRRIFFTINEKDLLMNLYAFLFENKFHLMKNTIKTMKNIKNIKYFM